MRNLHLPLAAAFLILLGSLGHAQTVTSVLRFTQDLSNYGAVVTPAQGRDGRLYGTTDGFSSNTNPDGTIFKINTDGSGVDVLFAFNGANGQLPASGVMLSTDGNYYGTAGYGGESSAGVLFKIAPTGDYTLLYQFSGGADGGAPIGPIQGADGNLYGVTITGGNGDGTVFKYSPSTGTLSTILSLNADGSQGNGPNAALIQASDGSLYGNTYTGGANNCGTIFRLTTTGVMLNVYSFPCGLGGSTPQAPLYEASDGNLYGTTFYGGKVNSSGDCKKGCGTVFRVAHGLVSVIYRFSGYPTDGALGAGLTEGTDGNLYGGTDRGGAHDFGTLYQITTSGQYKLLYSFVDTVGSAPVAPLMQHTNGKFYGTAAFGGQGYGTIYSLDMGLGPFIALVRYTGRIGQAVQILGQGLTGSTAVTINGVASTSFKVVTDRYMTAVIPTGATTGPVVVTTTAGTLTSNHNLQIVQ